MRSPFIWKNSRECESNLGEFRISAGLTVLELCEKVGIPNAYYSKLNSGEMSPLTEKGSIRDAAQQLAAFFNAELSDIWPRYFCSTPSLPLTDGQIIERWHPEMLDHERKDPEEVIIRGEIRAKICKMFSCLNNKQKDVYIKRLNGEVLEEIGDEMKVSRERVRQLELEAKRKIERTVEFKELQEYLHGCL